MGFLKINPHYVFKHSMTKEKNDVIINYAFGLDYHRSYGPSERLDFLKSNIHRVLACINLDVLNFEN